MDAPPPYSKTDPSDTSISGATLATAYSHGSAALTPYILDAENVAADRSLPSNASSADDVLFTPSYSPTLSSHAFADHDHLISSSAVAYFDSRPVTIQNTGPPIVYNIAVHSNTQHENLPFPRSFLAQGVSDQDWATFVNYLLPDHIISASRDRKDKTESGDVDERMQRLNVGEKRTNQVTSLHQSEQNRESTNRLEATILEWNEGFFNPRGLQITKFDAEAEIGAGEAVEAETFTDPTRQIPGAWIPPDHIPYDHEILGGPSVGRKRGFFGGFKSFQGGSQGGFRMGPIVADNDGFRMGNVFVADQNGVRLGGKSFMRRESTDPERGRGHSHRRHHRRHNRSSSMSSSSSSSSDSSTASDSSVGSLPEYDDLRDQQLPAAKQSLLNWINQPEQPLTRRVVRQIQQEIQIAKGVATQNHEQDLDNLRREVRNLMKEFREGKKRHKRDQRQARRERRALKRAQKTERRIAKRDARRLRREGKCSKGKEPSRRPPWATSKSTAELLQPPPMPPRPQMPEISSSFPFARAASVPAIYSPPFCGPNSPQDPVPSAAAMHSTWPYTRAAPYSPGNTPVSHLPGLPGSFPNAVADSSEQLYAQAKEMEELARSKEELAIQLRTEATSRGCGEKDRLKKFDQAAVLEEEAEKYIMEADRLRAEVLHLDSELARDLEEMNGRGHPAGVIQS